MEANKTSYFWGSNFKYCVQMFVLELSPESLSKSFVKNCKKCSEELCEILSKLPSKFQAQVWNFKRKVLS